MGKPVVASALPMLIAMFPAGTVATYRSGDTAGMVSAILTLVDHPVAREAAVTRTEAVVRDAAWERESIHYLEIVEALIAGSRPGRRP
jgi:hypothetical protein